MKMLSVHYFAVADPEHGVGYLFAMGAAPREGYTYELTQTASGFGFQWFPPETGSDRVTPFAHSIELGDALGMRSTMVTDNEGEWQVFISYISVVDRTPALTFES